MKKVMIKSVLFDKDSATVIDVSGIIDNCTNVKDKSSYNNQLTINTPTSSMKHIPEIIKIWNDEDNISFTSSVTFIIDAPKIEKDYVNGYLRSIENNNK